MKKNVTKIVVACVAYGGTLLASAIYLSWVYIGSMQPIDIKGQLPIVSLAFIISIIALVANITIIIKYTGGLRILSVLGVLLSLAVAALLIPPLGFSLG